MLCQSLSESRGRFKVTKPIFSNTAKRDCKSVRVQGDGKREKWKPLSFPSSPACFLFNSSQPVTQKVLRGGETRLQFLVYVSISVSQSVSQYYNLPH